MCAGQSADYNGTSLRSQLPPQTFDESINWTDANQSCSILTPCHPVAPWIVVTLQDLLALVHTAPYPDEIRAWGAGASAGACVNALCQLTLTRFPHALIFLL